MLSNESVHETNWDLKIHNERPKHGNIWKSLVDRLRKDTTFRYKIKRSAAVTWSIFLVGWLKGLIGPSFPEILYLTDTPLEQGSAYLTVMYTCKILGHALGGPLYDRVDKDLYSTVLPVINALVMIIFPWCRTYATMITMYGVHGLMISSMEIGLIAATVNIWDREASQTYVQITMFFFSISTIASPIAIIPFLMSNFTTVHLTSLQNATYGYDGSGTSPTHVSTIVYTADVDKQMLSNNRSLSTGGVDDQQSILYIGFAVSAVLVLTGAMPFASFFLSKRCYTALSKDEQNPPNDVSPLSKSQTSHNYERDYKEPSQTDKDVDEVLLPESTHEDLKPDISKSDNNLTQNRSLLCSQPLVALLFTVSCVFGALHSALEISMSDLMPTFCRNYLKWSASHAAMTVSLLFSFFTVGRISCAFLVKFMSLTKVLSVFVVLIILGSVGISVSTSVFSTPGIWVSIGVIGLGISACYPSQLGWTTKYLVLLTGKLTSILLCTSYIGTVIAPPLLSFLVTKYGYPFLCYGILTMSCMTFICVAVMELYVYKTEKDRHYS